MRVRVDRGAEAVYIELGAAAEARRETVAEGVTVVYGAAGQVVGVEVRGVDPGALHEFAVDLTDALDRPAPVAAPTPAVSRLTTNPAVTPGPAYFTGPVGWDPEAAAAVAQIPFFRRGPVRLAAIALARKRGLDRVTPDLVIESRNAR